MSVFPVKVCPSYPAIANRLGHPAALHCNPAINAATHSPDFIITALGLDLDLLSLSNGFYRDTL